MRRTFVRDCAVASLNFGYDIYDLVVHAGDVRSHTSNCV